MSIKTDIRPVTYLKSKAADLLAQVNETHRHVVITQNGEPKAVLQDLDSFQEMKKALTMMKLIYHSESAIKEGKTSTHEEVFSELEQRLQINE
ncbi:MAG: type II toxin-antitoxin system Phd/YefM family antitoxin [Kiritimatiellae bacterium]|nr:type II toxin-antitoxin system Phd/YefM family antitoxin [Kiritimatiellia bacterium]